MISRGITPREFVSSTINCGAAGLGLTTLAAEKEAKRRAIKYIDIHTHLGAFYDDKELTADLLVRFMDAHDIEKSGVLPLISPEAAQISQPVSTAIAAFEKYPDRIILFCGRSASSLVSAAPNWPRSWCERPDRDSQTISRLRLQRTG